MTLDIMLTLAKRINVLLAQNDDIANVTKLPRVDILYAYADMSAYPIDASVANGAKGIVIAGVGNGNMNKGSLEAAARAAKKVVVVRSSRVVTGTVGRNVEGNEDEVNFVASDELNPRKARILLMWALLKPRATAEIQNLFYSY
jgi:L-asparaginase